MGNFRHMERRPLAEMRSRGNNSGSPIDLASVDFTCAAREPAPSAIASMGRAAPPSAMARRPASGVARKAASGGWALG